MHWVDRGSEPSRLAEVRRKHTDRWVSHYRDNIGERPPRPRLKNLRIRLRRRFHDICGYCEEEDTPGTLDHFKPKSKFPELVYEWSNWVFACRGCNNFKGCKWPDGGYVDPCACLMSERPENFFDFDLDTGSIIPLSLLSEERHSKSWNTIEDIGLNDSEHLKKRIARIELVKLLLSFSANTPHPDIEQYTRRLTDRDRELSSLTRKVLGEYGATGQIQEKVLEP